MIIFKEDKNNAFVLGTTPVSKECKTFTSWQSKTRDKLSKDEFIKKYCNSCGSQRCEGPESEWFEGCRMKTLLKEE